MAKNAEVRTGSLDFLRIIATILIVFHHFQQVTGARFGGIDFYGGNFNYGLIVEFFFVLSGFFMFRYITRIKQGLSFKKFILKRVTRLLPLVLISSIVYCIFLYFYSLIYQDSWHGVSISVWGIILNALGVQSGWVFENPGINNPTWYISVLILCYIIFYFVTYVCKRLKVTPFYAYVFIILIGCGIVSYGIDLPFLNQSSARGYYAFFFGLLLAKFMNKRKINLKTCLASVIVVALLTWMIISRKYLVDSGLNYLMTFLYYPALIIICFYPPIMGLFRCKIFEFLGKITYDVYVWHASGLILMYILVAKFVPSLNILSVWTMLAFTSIQFGVGIASYYLIERPINKVIKEKYRI